MDEKQIVTRWGFSRQGDRIGLPLMYEITSVDTGKTIVMTRSEAEQMFGKNEFKEMLAGSLPHLIVVKL